MQVVEQKILAFKQIHGALKDVLAHAKCRPRTGFNGDVLAKVQDALKRFNESEPEHRLPDIEADFELWDKDVDLLKAHG